MCARRAACSDGIAHRRLPADHTQIRALDHNPGHRTRLGAGYTDAQRSPAGQTNTCRVINSWFAYVLFMFVSCAGIVPDACPFHHNSSASTMDRQDAHSYRDSDKIKRHTKNLFFVCLCVSSWMLYRCSRSQASTSISFDSRWCATGGPRSGATSCRPC
jgi:hypothetical protein